MIHITSTVKTLRDMMKPVEAVADECRLNISPEGLSVKVVDPANVAMINLNLPKEVFHEGEYTVDETLQVGLDVIAYLSLFETVDDENYLYDESAELKVEPFEKDGKQRHSLILRIAGIFEQTLNLPPPDGMRKVPKLPAFNLRAEVEVSKEFLKRCFDMAEKAGDYIRMQASDKYFPLFIMETGEDEHIIRERKFRTDLTTGVKVTVESPEIRLKSLFSLDYLHRIIRAIGDGEIINMRFDNDHPLVLNFKVLDHGQASYMQAPRVESE